jgi:hypothetical protein
MSNTRRADPGTPFSQHRYMSAPEFAELRGINLRAVAEKAWFLGDPKKKSLIFFIQALSLQPGGLKNLATQLLESFPERIGTKTMHEQGMRPDKMYSGDSASKIRKELGLTTDDRFRHQAALAKRIEAIRNGEDCAGIEVEPAKPISADFCLRHCRELAETLEDFLVEFCINPKVPVLDGEPLKWFKDVSSALAELQSRHAQNIRKNLAMTSIGENVFDALDMALEIGRGGIVIEGLEGFSKSHFAKAWCDMHLGEARFSELTGVCSKTSVFRKLAKAYGTACNYNITTTELQARIEEVSEKSRLLLVIDEAHYAMPQGERVYNRPEVIDWIDTALINAGVPVALVTTPLFTYRLHQAEKQTGWNAGQFNRRFRHVPLPANLPKADFEIVTRKRLPEAGKREVAHIVSYALTSPRHLSAVTDTVDEARVLARRAGRERVTFEDIDAAIQQFRIPSDKAQSSDRFEKPKRRLPIGSKALPAAGSGAAIALRPSMPAAREIAPPEFSRVTIEK